MLVNDWCGGSGEKRTRGKEKGREMTTYSRSGGVAGDHDDGAEGTVFGEHAGGGTAGKSSAFITE